MSLVCCGTACLPSRYIVPVASDNHRLPARFPHRVPENPPGEGGSSFALLAARAATPWTIVLGHHAVVVAVQAREHLFGALVDA